MKRNVLFSFCFLIAIIGVSFGASFASSANSEDLPVSYGLYVMAEDNGMAVCTVKGNKLNFDANTFARGMNLKSVSSITVTQVPPITDGELLVGSNVVNKGQTVSGANIALMSYVSKSQNGSPSYFKFRVGESTYDVKCSIYMLDKANSAPTLNNAASVWTDVNTHKNTTFFGMLPCYDTDGDETVIEIVSYPESGALNLLDRKTGSYTYTPNENYTGKDSFEYVARDKYGNYSASKTVKLNVNKPKTAVTYGDMKNSPMYNAALDVTEAGVMNGVQIGDSMYFQPEKTVSRGDFLVMAMNAKGIKGVSSEKTVFADDSEIPEYMKGYVSAAYELGYIKGEYLDGKLCFFSNRDITRAEAAVIACNMVDAVTPTVTPVFKDGDSIPTFAKAAVLSMNYMGILNSSDGNINACNKITRGDAAYILSALINTDGKQH